MELTLDQALQKGVEAHRAGKVQEADRYYTAILKANSKHPDANHNMGVLAVGIGKIQEALPFFKIALEANPKVAQFWLSYIDALIKLDRMADAKAAFDQAKKAGMEGDGFDKLENTLVGIDIVPTANQPTEENQIQNLMTMYGERRLDQVFDEARKLIEKYPKNLTLWNLMGASAAQTKRLDQAVFAFQEAIKIKPDYADAYNNMGNAFQDQGKLDEALEAYKNALSINRNYAESFNNMGNALKKQGKLDEALEAYNNALSIKPDSAEIYSNMGIVEKQKGDLEKAIKAYKKALAINPNLVDIYNNLGNAFHDQGELVEAIEAYNKAIALKPGCSDAFNNLGIAFKDQGKLVEAVEAYTQAIALKPDYAEAYNHLGNALKDHGKFEEAVKAYKKALEIKPDYAEAQHMLSSLSDITPKTAPREYVEKLFDGYAKRFEVSLVDTLDYNIPNLITDILIQTNINKSLGSVLDLGCGTGLLGQNIKGHCSELEGIDLSNKMLEIASQKKVYDKLSQSDIIEYLSSMPLDFDFYVALDVFIYIGELTEIFHLIKSRSKKPGKLVFSTEHTEKDGCHLLKTGRFSHSQSYILNLCKYFDYKMSHFSTSKLRKEKSSFLIGGIYVLELT